MTETASMLLQPAQDDLPRSAADWLRDAKALAASGAAGEADLLLARAFRTVPQSVAIGFEYARSAERLGLVPESIERWQAVHQRFPDDLGACLNLVAALSRGKRFDEAECVCAAATRHFPKSWQVFAEQARLAEKRGQLETALLLWTTMQERFPDEPAGYTGAAITLMLLNRVYDAERLLAPAVERFPKDNHLLGASILAAEVRHDWQEALKRLEPALRVRPDHQGLNEKYITTLRLAGDLAKAAAEVHAVSARFPASVRLLEERAILAASCSNWDDAIATWQEMRALTPAASRPVLEIARILLRQRRLAEAAQFLAANFSEIADRFSIEIERAQLARLSGNHAEAVRRWAALDDVNPADARVVIGLAQIHMDMRNAEACRPYVERLLASHRHDVVAQTVSAHYLAWQDKLEEALTVVREASARWPFNKAIQTQLAEMQARVEKREQAEGRETAAAHMLAVTASAAGKVSGIIEKFVSLGGDQGGCEFGLVQRRLGANSLGLLRWSNISPNGLIMLLERKCEGLGTRPQTAMWRDGSGDYRLGDSLYEMMMHTFIDASNNPAEILFPKLAKRQAFLGRMLLDSLQDGDRICVYKTRTLLDAETRRRLWDAFRALGPNALLLVQLAGADFPAGSVQVLEPGLMIGAVDRFSTGEVSLEVWSDLCCAACDAWPGKNRVS